MEDSKLKEMLEEFYSDYSSFPLDKENIPKQIKYLDYTLIEEVNFRKIRWTVKEIFRVVKAYLSYKSENPIPYYQTDCCYEYTYDELNNNEFKFKLYYDLILKYEEHLNESNFYEEFFLNACKDFLLFLENLKIIKKEGNYFVENLEDDCIDFVFNCYSFGTEEWYDDICIEENNFCNYYTDEMEFLNYFSSLLEKLQNYIFIFSKKENLKELKSIRVLGETNYIIKIKYKPLTFLFKENRTIKLENKIFFEKLKDEFKNKKDFKDFGLYIKPIEIKEEKYIKKEEEKKEEKEDKFDPFDYYDYGADGFGGFDDD